MARTFRDKSRPEDLFATLEEIAEELERDLQRTQYSGRTVTLIYRLHTYERESRLGAALDSPGKSRARSIGKFVQSKAEILPVRSRADAHTAWLTHRSPWSFSARSFRYASASLASASPT